MDTHVHPFLVDTVDTVDMSIRLCMSLIRYVHPTLSYECTFLPLIVIDKHAAHHCCRIISIASPHITVVVYNINHYLSHNINLAVQHVCNINRNLTVTGKGSVLPLL